VIEVCPAGRGGIPDEVGTVGALSMDGAFITGSDFLMDGGIRASYRFGELASKRSNGRVSASAQRNCWRSNG
jgi:hypothetical protein